MEEENLEQLEMVKNEITYAKDIFLSFQKEEILKKTFLDVLNNEFLIQFPSHETKSAYKRDISHFFSQLNVVYLSDLASIHFSDVSKAVTEYIYSFKKTPDKNPNRILNPKTINRKAYSLSSFFNFLVDTYHYAKNPVAKFKPEQANKTSNTQSLSRGEIQEILIRLKQNHKTSKRNYRNYLLVSFMFVFALRRNEVANLQWQDIYFFAETPYLEVYQKGRTLKRLPLPAPLKSLLLEFKENFASATSYIFTPIINNSTKDTLKPLSNTQINRIVSDIVKEIIPDKNITPHSFRKTFIEIALSNNVSLVDIMNGTGHSSVEMVKYYDSRSNLDNNAVNVVYIGIL